MLAYEDAAAALDWLSKAYGFRERTRITMNDGSIAQAEMQTGSGRGDHDGRADTAVSSAEAAPRDLRGGAPLAGGSVHHRRLPGLCRRRGRAFRPRQERRRDDPLRAPGQWERPGIPNRRPRGPPLDVRQQDAPRSALAGRGARRS